MRRRHHVYVLASRRNGTLYVGVTGNLAYRVWLHREGRGATFTRRYGVKLLVWYVAFDEPLDGIAFEKRLKRWRRAGKLALIEKDNPTWRDLYETLNQ
ncbi:GIY-YIG nuclease family protein [Caulobacter mirabilis]|uniref:GIY-YIG domain-containing protein n=1 Tax=Caulobacter mirabilis TaxID=69666 RepID=A0A2D2B114_9CAUL|nr:GIY-YIG nuclease family protein [Caulobacter mirabilis]ATQ43926.1 hypothetical protein CSW64_16770 [Caulobacter mirabilis]